MQTFLPYKSFIKSLSCLDDKRLGKQRVEAMQILNALQPGSTSRWRNHPAVKMWRGYESELMAYMDIAIYVWVERGFKNTMRMNHPFLSRFLKDSFSVKIEWLTDDFCAAHRSNLLRKNFEYYSKFGWKESTDLPYIWPV